MKPERYHPIPAVKPIIETIPPSGDDRMDRFGTDGYRMREYKANRPMNSSDLILWNLPLSKRVHRNSHKNTHKNRLIARRRSLLLRIAECANEIERIDEQLRSI